MFQNKKCLFLAPHTDDVELGCGGTLARVIEEGGEAHVVAFSTAKESLPAGAPENQLELEFLAAMDTYNLPENQRYVYDFQVRKLSYHRQEVLENLVKLRQEIQPDWIFVPSGNDLHQDHQVVFNEGLRAFKDKTVWGYELPWNHITFNAQGFIKLQEHHIEMKFNAMLKYETQLKKKRLYFERSFIEGLARMRGLQIKEQFAEAFEVLRIQI